MPCHPQQTPGNVKVCLNPHPSLRPPATCIPPPYNPRSPSPVLERSTGVSKSKTSSLGCCPRVAAPAVVPLPLLAPTPVLLLLICCSIISMEEHDDDGGRAEDVTRTRTRVLTPKPATCLARSASDVMVAAGRMCMVRRCRWSLSLRVMRRRSVFCKLR